MKFTNRPKWKRIALAVICLIGLLVIAGGSFAAYTSQDFQRGVARNRDNEAVRFTSNYLQSFAYSANLDAKSFAGRTVLFSDTEKDKDLSIDIWVYNYAGSTTLVNQKDITYNMTISFGEGSGTGYKVTTDTGTVSQNGTTYTISEVTLPGITPTAHKYTVTFPGSDLDKLKITATAIPQNVSVTNNQMLAAVIAPCTGATTQTFSFDGKFTDTSAKPADYRGFNYEISISSGQATATLKWDTAALEIDKFFLINLGKTKEEISEILTAGVLNLTMNQPEGTGDYLIPFYIKDISKIPDSAPNATGEAADKAKEQDWAIMENKITFIADQITQ